MGMSRRAYARYRGCSEKAVRNAIRDGRISVEEDDTIDPVKADAHWAANTDPLKSPLRGYEQPERVRADMPTRLAEIAREVPPVGPFVPWINWLSSRLGPDLDDLDSEGMPADTPHDMHLLLSGSLITFLYDTGVISEEVFDEADHVLCDPAWQPTMVEEDAATG